MLHFYSNIKDREQGTNSASILNECDFVGNPYSLGGKQEIAGYHVQIIKDGLELSGRGIRKDNVQFVNPATKKHSPVYSLTICAYKKLCERHEVAENLDTHWF